MSLTTKTMLSAVVLAAVAVATGCAATTSDGAQDANDEQRPEPGTTSMSAEGLTLDAMTEGRVAGRFTKDGVAIRFDFERTATLHHAKITFDDGAPLFESTLVDGYDTTVYLGGKATVKGPATGEPEEKLGDQGAIAALVASPEGLLVPLLKEALLAAHVDNCLFRDRAADSTATVGVKDLTGGWHLIGFPGSYGFWSWSWWGTTTVVLQGVSGHYNASFYADGTATNPEYVSGYGQNSYRRQWWGAHITVKNTWAPLCGVTPPYTCQDTRVWLDAY